MKAAAEPGQSGYVCVHLQLSPLPAAEHSLPLTAWILRSSILAAP